MSHCRSLKSDVVWKSVSFRLCRLLNKIEVRNNFCRECCVNDFENNILYLGIAFQCYKSPRASSSPLYYLTSLPTAPADGIFSDGRGHDHCVILPWVGGIWRPGENEEDLLFDSWTASCHSPTRNSNSEVKTTHMLAAWPGPVISHIVGYV